MGDEEEEEEFEEEEEEEEDYEEEEEDEDVPPARANRKLFWAGLIALIIGSQIVALGSFVHNKLGIFVTPDNAWGTPGSYAVYGPYDQMTGIIGIVVTLIAFFLIFMYMKQQRDEEKYRKYVEEHPVDDEDVEQEEFNEPVLVQNKLFFWIGLGLLLFTGPLGVIFGFAAENPSDVAGTAGIASGSTLTIIGFILIFLAIRAALFGSKEEPEEEESEEEEEEVEEDYEDEEELEDEEYDEEEELEEDEFEDDFEDEEEK